MDCKRFAFALLAISLCASAWAQVRPLAPKRACVLATEPAGLDACTTLPAEEFAPLTTDDYLALRREDIALSSCILSLGLKDPKPNLFGENLDDKLWRRTIKAGKAPELVREAATLPGYLGVDDPALASAKQASKQFRRVIWGLMEYSVQPQRTAIEAARAQALYSKYTAMGSEGACQASPVFLSLLNQAKAP